MRDNHHHTDLWAERLSQVSLPDGDAAWEGMQLLLDKRMPVKKDRRRWILLILLLLLLIGVCNCPGRFGSRVRHGSEDQVVRASGERGGGGGGGEPGANAGSPNGRGSADRGVPAGGPDGGGSSDRGVPAGNPDGGGSADRGVPAGGPDGSLRSGRAIPAVPGGGAPASPDRAIPSDHGMVSSPNRGIPAKVTASGSGRKGHKPKGREAFLNEEENITASDTGRSGTNPAPAGKKEEGVVTPPAPGKSATPPAKKDSSSTQKKKEPPREEKKQRAAGWTVGIGLNQFFTIGGQQASHYNSGGISGTLGDYIPVPMVRYHFNRKFFIQLEAQLNSPQYTGKDLLISLPPLDSLSPTVRRQSSVLIKKLFYFNVPLSLHYNVFRGLDLGAGIQFSRLSNGIGLFQDRTMNIGPGGIPDSLSATSKSIKGDTLYKKIRTTELRALLDASYTQGRFIFGIRYNQALSQFIHVQVAPGQITQARNSSLQLYLRYVLWDNQKKAPYTTK